MDRHTWYDFHSVNLVWVVGIDKIKCGPILGSINKFLSSEFGVLVGSSTTCTRFRSSSLYCQTYSRVQNGDSPCSISCFPVPPWEVEVSS